eukprot:2263551-Karenia_brevis.AAC.1
MWAKHRKRDHIRMHIGDESKCQVCGVDFHCRARLIKHLSETRLRSKHRRMTCREEFLASNPTTIPES